MASHSFRALGMQGHSRRTRNHRSSTLVMIPYHYSLGSFAFPRLRRAQKSLPTNIYAVPRFDWNCFARVRMTMPPDTLLVGKEVTVAGGMKDASRL